MMAGPKSFGRLQSGVQAIGRPVQRDLVFATKAGGVDDLLADLAGYLPRQELHGGLGPECARAFWAETHTGVAGAESRTAVLKSRRPGTRARRVNRIPAEAARLL